MSKGRCYRSVVVRSDATKTETFLLLLLFCLFWVFFAVSLRIAQLDFGVNLLGRL